MSPDAQACRSRARTTFRNSPDVIRDTAAETACSHSGALRLPSLQRTSAGFTRGLERNSGTAPCAAIVVCHDTPDLRPTTIAGTIRTEPSEAGSKVKLPNATGPVPGTPTSSRTVAASNSSASHFSPAANRSTPAGIVSRAASPQPTTPSPWCIHADAAGPGSRPSKSPGSTDLTVLAVRPSATGRTRLFCSASTAVHFTCAATLR